MVRGRTSPERLRCAGGREGDGTVSDSARDSVERPQLEEAHRSTAPRAERPHHRSADRALDRQVHVELHVRTASADTDASRIARFRAERELIDLLDQDVRRETERFGWTQ